MQAGLSMGNAALVAAGWLTWCVCVLGVLLIKDTPGVFLGIYCIVFSFKNVQIYGLLEGFLFVISCCIVFFFKLFANILKELC